MKGTDMKKSLRIATATIAFCALAAFALAGCAGSQQTPSSSSSDVVTLDAEGVISVYLDYNAGTGYEWQCKLSGDTDALGIVNEWDKNLAEDENISGGPLQHCVTMRAAKPGNVVLTCELVRPWEKDVEPAETQVFSFTVDSDLQIHFNADESTYENEPEQGSNS